MAQVHADVLDGKPVALKILQCRAARDHAAAVRGLKREIMLMTLMEHPNVLRSLAMGEHDSNPFMVTDSNRQ